MQLNRSIPIAVTVVASAITGTALAQDDAAVEPMPMMAPASPTVPGRTVDVVPAAETPKHWMPGTGWGLAVMAGGGATDFTNGGTRATTSPGGSWTLRVAIVTRRILGFEASYVGGANTIDGRSFGNATLIRNGFEGALRINGPIYAGSMLLEPYILGGLGWNAYHVSNYTPTGLASFSAGTDNTLSVPLAAGFMLGYHGFVADARFTVRPTYDQSIFQGETTSALSNWDAGGMIGYEF
jgi:hypothetical protein